MEIGEQLLQLNNYFSKNYAALVDVAKRTQNRIRGGYLYNKSTSNEGVNLLVYQNDFKDCIHDAYIKVKHRIEASGFTAPYNVTGMTLIVLRNVLIDRHKEETKRTYTCASELNGEVEQRLQYLQEVDESTGEYLDEIRYLSKEIFQYLDTRYSDKELAVFRIYFLTPKMTYRKVAELSGFSKSFVNDAIKQIKQDLRANLKDYLTKKQF